MPNVRMKLADVGGGAPSNQSVPFMAMPLALYRGAAFKALKPSELAVLIYILSKYNGSNNGKLAVSIRCIKENCHIGTDNALKCIGSLRDKGLISIQTEFPIQQRMATEYCLNWLKNDVTGESAKYVDWGLIPNNSNVPEKSEKKIDDKNTRRIVKSFALMAKEEGFWDDCPF